MKIKLLIALASVSLLFSPLISISAQEHQLDSYSEKHEKSFELLEGASESSLTSNELLNQIEDANTSVESVEYNVNMLIEIVDGSYESHSLVDALFNIFYDTNQSIEYGYLKTTSVNEDVEETQEILMVPGNQKNLYVRSAETDDWNNVTQDIEVNTYSAYPDYFSLLDIIYGMEDDLELLETNDQYLLNLTSDGIDLLSLFQEEYDISITGIDQSMLDKHALFAFNKDNLLLNFLHISFYTEEERFAFYIDIQTDFSNWNELDSSFILRLVEDIE